MCAFQDWLWLQDRSEILQQQQQQQKPLKLVLDDRLILPTNDVNISNCARIDFKKIRHNENERQRRKKLNAFYATLRSMLPHTNNKKKLSAPAVVCRVLKYIPQVKNKIQILSRKRDALLAVKNKSEESAEVPSNLKFDENLEKNESAPIDVRVSAVSKMEAVITVESPRTSPLLLSNILVLLEQERMDVVNASTFLSYHLLWHSIHLKVIESSSSVELSGLRLKILLGEKPAGPCFAS